MNKGWFFGLIVALILHSPTSLVSGETNPILITYSETMKDIIFDGIWTHRTEWKQSSLNEYRFDGTFDVKLRTAHQGDFIYVMINAVSDTNLDLGSDKAIVCLDGSNDKTLLASSDDFCFGVALGNKNGFTLQGGSTLGLTNNFKKIPNPNDFIAVGNVSDEHDKYSKIPHASYEFKIPIELLGRSHEYGFYFTLYESHENKFYSWPNVNPEKPLKIPSPNNWGEIISPDKSLPEFSWPLLALIPAMFSVIFLVRLKNGFK